MVLKVSVLILALIGVVSLGVRVIGYAENPESHFSNYNDLAASDLISKGWLPPYLPKSISDITETHNIDSGRVWATFKYDPMDISSIEDACQTIFNSTEGKKYVCPPYEKQATIVVLKKDGQGSLESAPNDL